MDSLQRTRMLWRIPLLAAIAAALSWGAWSFFGDVPVVREVVWFNGETVALPIHLSRWWDVALAPVWALALTFILTSAKVREDSELFTGLVLGLFFGLLVGLVAGLVFGLPVGLLAGLFFGLLVGLIFGLPVGLFFGLLASLFFGLLVGLFFGLPVGLLAGLFFGLLVGLIFGLAAIFRFIFNRRFLVAAGQWIVGK